MPGDGTTNVTMFRSLSETVSGYRASQQYSLRLSAITEVPSGPVTENSSTPVL